MPVFLWVRNDIKNMNPQFAGTGQQVAGNNRLVAGSGFQATLGFNGDHGAARQDDQPVRAMFYLILAEKGGPVAVNPSRRLSSPE